jgi:hypothetical protein
MSVWCHKRTHAPRQAAIFLAEFSVLLRRGRSVPTTEVADSFDHLIGLREQRRRAGKQCYASLASPIA